jgi:hypothetical protein
MGSKKFTLDLGDAGVLIKNALFVGAAAGVTYIAQNLGDLDVGDMGALLVPVVAVALDAVVKWFKDNRTDKEDKE